VWRAGGGNAPIISSTNLPFPQAFLSLCQGNHYQFDSLRRAKHSSMMVLYHLHNPTVSAALLWSCCACSGWGVMLCMI